MTDNYNQVEIVENNTCITESTTGSFCAVWENSSIITYNYFDLIILIAIPLFLFVVYNFVFKLLRKHR